MSVNSNFEGPPLIISGICWIEMLNGLCNSVRKGTADVKTLESGDCCSKYVLSMSQNKISVEEGSAGLLTARSG